MPTNTLGKREFDMRFYRWALKDFTREVEEEFPFLSTIKDSSAINIVSYMLSLSKDDRIQLSKALVKKAHPDAVKLLDEHMTAEEQRHVRFWIDYSTYSPSALRANEEYWAALSASPPINRDNFGNAIRQGLIPVIGEVAVKRGKRVWVHERQIGDWSIRTTIDIGGRYHQLAYSHDIGMRPQFTLTDCFKQFVSIYSWLGLGGMTCWNRLTGHDLDMAVKALSDVCRKFIGAAPELLEGLSTTSFPGGPNEYQSSEL